MSQLALELHKISAWALCHRTSCMTDVLKLKIPMGVKICIFTDYITLEVYGEPIEEFELTNAHASKGAMTITTASGTNPENSSIS